MISYEEKIRFRHQKLAGMLNRSILISSYSSAYLVLQIYWGDLYIALSVLTLLIIMLFSSYKKREIFKYLNNETFTIVYYFSVLVVFFIVAIELESYLFIILYGIVLAYHFYKGFREGLDTLDDE